jgi:endonuclease/exonuclease/phosphatase family metal-dependent hydrolase
VKRVNISEQLVVFSNHMFLALLLTLCFEPFAPDRVQGNVALVVVLEEVDSGKASNPLMSGMQSSPMRVPPRRKRRLCVANTHIYWDPEYEDVKLWQTWVLCQELEKLVLERQLPMLLCGDFNSMPDSAVYDLLSSDRYAVDTLPVHSC